MPKKKKQDFLSQLWNGGIKELKNQDKRIERGCRKRNQLFK